MREVSISSDCKKSGNGSFWYIPNIEAYSAGVRAAHGHEIVHRRLLSHLTLNTGIAKICEHLIGIGLSPEALCGLEIRTPRPMAVTEFQDFNSGYIDILKAAGIDTSGGSPIARTNASPYIGSFSEPHIHGFSYVAPATSRKSKNVVTFVISGVAESSERGSDFGADPSEHHGDMTLSYAQHVVAELERRIDTLGGTQHEPTDVNIYTALNLNTEVQEHASSLFRGAVGRGLHLYQANPPMNKWRFEMDTRRVFHDRWLAL